MSVPSKYLILMTLALIANFNLMLSLRDSFAVSRDYNFLIPASQNTASGTAECRETTRNHSSVLQTELFIVRNESLQLNQLLNQRTEELQQLQKRYRQVAYDLRKSQGRTQIAKIALPTNLVEDSFLFGKSCQRVGTEWVCRDCRGDETLWEACSLLQPHSPCSPWDFGGLDDPRPRLVTRHDDHATTDGLRFVMERMGYRGAYEQFPCLELQDCFNLTRCENTREALQVYIYGEYGDPITRKLANELSGIVQITNQSDACLLVVTPRTLRGQKDGYTQLVQQESWMEGRNHFMFRSHWILNYEFDRFVGKDHFHRAALSGPNFFQGVFRVGYDISLYYDHPQHPFVVNDTIYNLVQSQIHRSRPYMLTFQGTIKKILPWFSHRWLASAYWPRDDPQVFANVRCPADNVTMKQQVDYVSALTSSTFVFCPGGRSPGSWRWGEALALGAIPVVTSDFVPPFYPEVDWRGCLVTVNEGRIIDLPRILREITAEEIWRRQERCHRLFQGLIGWGPSRKGGFEIDLEGAAFDVSMRIWKLRIETELAKLGRRKKLELQLGVHNTSLA